MGTAVLLLLGGLVPSGAFAADEAAQSGPSVGSGVKAFTVQAVTGGQKGSRLCYV
ncbi:MAG: hypothetical protein ACODAJ_09395 [Planctomycetota bacterium]